MKILSRIELEETMSRNIRCFRDDQMEVEAQIGSRMAMIYFDVSLTASYYTEETGTFLFGAIIDVELMDGYFTDDGDPVVMTKKRARELEDELKQLIREEL